MEDHALCYRLESSGLDFPKAEDLCCCCYRLWGPRSLEIRRHWWPFPQSLSDQDIQPTPDFCVLPRLSRLEFYLNFPIRRLSPCAFLYEHRSVLETVSLRSTKFQIHYSWCRKRVFHIYVADSTSMYTVAEGREVEQSKTRKYEVQENPTFSSILQLP